MPVWAKWFLLKLLLLCKGSPEPPMFICCICRFQMAFQKSHHKVIWVCVCVRFKRLHPLMSRSTWTASFEVRENKEVRRVWLWIQTGQAFSGFHHPVAMQSLQLTHKADKEQMPKFSLLLWVLITFSMTFSSSTPITNIRFIVPTLHMYWNLSLTVS